jgi:hypothetical protein
MAIVSYISSNKNLCVIFPGAARGCCSCGHCFDRNRGRISGARSPRSVLAALSSLQNLALCHNRIEDDGATALGITTRRSCH